MIDVSVRCNVCNQKMEIATHERGVQHVVYVNPCKNCAAQQSVQADADYCTCLIKLPPLDLGDGMGACPSCNRPRR